MVEVMVEVGVGVGVEVMVKVAIAIGVVVMVGVVVAIAIGVEAAVVVGVGDLLMKEFDHTLPVVEFIEEQGLGFHLGCALGHLMMGEQSPDVGQNVLHLRHAVFYIERKILQLTRQDLVSPSRITADDLQAIHESRDRKFWSEKK